MPRRPALSPEKKLESQDKKRDAQQTRQKLLQAARICFSHNSFEHVGIRDIANEAGVNSTLIARYFGSKQALFEEAICTQFGFPENLPDTSPAALGRALAEWALTPHAETEFNLLLAQIHSAPSKIAGPLLATYFDARFVTPMSKHIDADDALLRSGMAAALTLGVSVLHDVMHSKAFTDANRDAMLDLFGKLFETCVSAPTTEKNKQR